MSLHPIAMLLPILTIFALLTSGIRAAVLVAAAALPMRTVAPIVAGSINVLAEQICFAIVFGAFFYQWFRRNSAATYIRVELESFLLCVLCGYAVVSAIVFPRLFSGVMVISVSNTDIGGVKYANDIMGLFLYPLQPSPGNLSQTAFLTFSAAVFMLLLSLGRRYGYSLLHRMVCVAAIVHIGFGFADIIGLDPIMSLMRTANYRINDGHNIMGFDRTIGMMVEASRYGIFGGALFAYFFALWMIRGSRGDGRFAALATLTDLSTFSTSAFVSIAAAFSVVAVRMLLKGGLQKGSAQRIGLLALGGGGGLVVLLVLSPLGNVLSAAFEALVLNKVESQSGMLRAATTYQSLATMVETLFLGAGSGSVTSNGLIPVWLGNLGLPGAVLFLALFWLFTRGGPRLEGQSRDAHDHWFAATTAVATLFISEGVSRTILDPGLLVMLYGALAVAARRPLVVSLTSDQRRAMRQLPD